MIPLRLTILGSLLRTRYNFGESMLKMRREKQTELAQKIKNGLKATYVSVTDTTIGTSSCGQMYNILVQSPLFQGKSVLAQQQLVNDTLKEQIKNIHGYSLKTRVPKKQEEKKSNKQEPKESKESKEPK